MKNRAVLVGLLTLFIGTQGFAQDSTQKKTSGGGFFGKVLDAVSQSAGSTGSLTNGDIASGLKEALRIGISKGADQASLTDGYFKNPLLNWPFRPKPRK